MKDSINLDFPVDVYDIDMFDTPAETIKTLHDKGKKVICYFSAGSWEDWREDADKFDKSIIGEPLAGWPGEKWLDIRQISLLTDIMSNRLDIAKEKGCDGVDPDNMDGYTQKSGFTISYDEQLAYNRFIASLSHNRSMAVGLKNDLEQIKDLVDDFDFAVNEECWMVCCW